MAHPSTIAKALAAQAIPSAAPLPAGVSPLAAGYSQWVGGNWTSPGLPRPLPDFLTGAFGPLSPILPMPIDQPADDTGRPTPRRWQYPVGWNLPMGQPGSEGYKLASFSALRRYADIYSVVRAMLNIRINELAGLSWDIGPTPDAQSQTKGDKNAVADQRARATKIVEWFRRVDSNYYGFQSWFTALLEEQFVIDAASLYVAPTRVDGKGLFGSDLAELQLLSGDTIRPLLDLRGATPRPPAVAYQQYLWGVPRTDLMAVIAGDDVAAMEAEAAAAGRDPDEAGIPDEEYRADQLLYLPRLRRSWTPYGFGAIEQAILPISIGLNRQSYLLDYYSEGTIPGVYVIAGDQYVTPAQQRQLQDTLNALAGDVAWKHRVIVLPPGSKTDPQKDLSFQRDVDQTVIEQVAMILHIQMQEISMLPGGRSAGLGGKGMAEEQAASVAATRTEPDRKWWKETLFDWVIQRVYRQTDLEWKWLDFQAEEDEAQKATAQEAYISIGKTTIDEERIEDGLDPWNLPYTKVPFIRTGNGIIPLDPTLAPLSIQPPGPGGPGEPGVPPQLGPGPSGPKGEPPTAAATAEPGKKKGNGKNGKAKNGKNGAVAPPTPPSPTAELASQGKVVRLTVADLVKGKVRYKGNLTNIVHDYLLRSYPPKDVAWTEDPKGAWTYEPKVPLDEINMARRPGGRDPSKVSAISRVLSSGASMDPIVLVEDDSNPKYRYTIADGWHRTLGAEDAGQQDVPAFIGSGFGAYLDTINGPMQDDSGSKKAALAELATFRRYLRKGGAAAAFRATAIDPDTMRLLRADLGTAEREVALDRARTRIGKQTGNPTGLIDWYNAGADGAIDWGAPGDFDQCVAVAGRYMADDDAKGFCNLRHQDAVGGPPGSEDKTISLGSPLATGLVPYDLAGATPTAPSQERCPTCGLTLDADGLCPRHGTAVSLLAMVEAELARRAEADLAT